MISFPSCGHAGSVYCYVRTGSQQKVQILDGPSVSRGGGGVGTTTSADILKEKPTPVTPIRNTLVVFERDYGGLPGLRGRERAFLPFSDHFMLIRRTRPCPRGEPGLWYCGEKKTTNHLRSLFPIRGAVVL